jgi:hypothetical protein
MARLLCDIDNWQIRASSALGIYLGAGPIVMRVRTVDHTRSKNMPPEGPGSR